MSREAFEAWYEQYRENACALYGAIDCIHPEDIAFASWRAGWQAARAAALEEAARKVEIYCGAWDGDGYALAVEIRALKEKE